MKKTMWTLVCGGFLCFSCVAQPPVQSSSAFELSSCASGAMSSVGPTMPDFSEYYATASRISLIYYWKDPVQGYMCILTRRSNVAPSMGQIQELQNNLACPVSTMKEIIDKKRADKQWVDPDNDVYEITSSVDSAEYNDILFAYDTYPTRNREIYSLLGLEDSYDRWYADSKQVYFKHDGLFDDEENPAFRNSAKYFTNLSHIYRWANANGEFRYAVVPEMDDCLGMGVFVSTAQKHYSFSAREMKKVVEAYYSITDVEMDNLVVDMPLLGADNSFAKDVRDNYPDNVSQDISLYRELGLEESYRRHFGVK